MGSSGLISLSDSIIRYESTNYGSWMLSLSDVIVIGEMTNDAGPFADDYFFCFVTRDHTWVEASYYAEGCVAFFGALVEKLGPLESRLANSTEFASNILWPPRLAGKPLFRFANLPHSSIAGRLLGIRRNNQELVPEVVIALTSNK